MSLDSPVVFMAVFCALAAIIGGLFRIRTMVIASILLFAIWALIVIVLIARGGASG